MPYIIFTTSILRTIFAASSRDKTKIRHVFMLLDDMHGICEATESGNIVASISLLNSTRRHHN